MKLFNDEIKNPDPENEVCIYPEFVERYFRWIRDEYKKVKENKNDFMALEYA